MIENKLDARIVKIACMGLQEKKHLGKSIMELQPSFEVFKAKFGFNVCGEGGEYETGVMDCPMFKRFKIEAETRVSAEKPDVIHVTLDPYPDAPVAFIRFDEGKCRITEKDPDIIKEHE
jgi:diphthine-ammonia ligase